MNEPLIEDVIRARDAMDSKPLPEDAKIYFFGDDTIEIFPDNLPVDHPFKLTNRKEIVSSESKG